MCEKRHCGIGICSGWRRTWRWTFDCWQSRQSRVQAAASAAKPRQTYFRDSNRRDASLPGWAMLWMAKKTFLRKGMGTIGRNSPVEVSPRRVCCPSRREPILRDEPPRRRCVSVQRACSAAMASKSIGSTNAAAAAVFPTGSGGGGKDGTKNQQRRFLSQAGRAWRR